ncbi:MAG: DEAD/DEAH box helicase [Erysipelotrichaceae bacterium]
MNSYFNHYPLSETILKAIDLMGYKNPTPVQERVIPLLLDGKDVIVKSQTGSGKTASFAIPLVESVFWEDNQAQALVLTPTRELALQVKEDIFHLGRFKRIKCPVLFGKDSFSVQAKELKQKSHIVVGTPGRVLDHLEQGTLDVSNIHYLVIDEADEMLNMGFIETVEAIIGYLPENRVTTLLSATMPEEVARLSKRYMNRPNRVEIEQESLAIDHIEQSFYLVEQNTKKRVLRDLSIIENPDSAIIFCNTQLAVESLHEYLLDNQFSCTKIHGGMKQEDRIKMMNQFRRNEKRYLIATDVAARGIDIDDISLVINYDMPVKLVNYIHRCGRTGRIGKHGKVINLLISSEKQILDQFESELKVEYPRLTPPTQAEVIPYQKAFLKKMSNIETKESVKTQKINQDILRLHINAGKKTKMRAGDIVGTLCDIQGVGSDDIGIIQVQDVSTYVEILNGKGQYVFETLQTTPIKGRLRKVSLANIEWHKK